MKDTHARKMLIVIFFCLFADISSSLSSVRWILISVAGRARPQYLGRSLRSAHLRQTDEHRAAVVQIPPIIRLENLVIRVRNCFQDVISVSNAGHLDVLTGQIPLVGVRPALRDSLDEVVEIRVTERSEEAVWRMVRAWPHALFAPL